MYDYEDESPRSSTPTMVAIASAVMLVLSLIVLGVAIAHQKKSVEQAAAQNAPQSAPTRVPAPKAGRTFHDIRDQDLSGDTKVGLIGGAVTMLLLFWAAIIIVALASYILMLVYVVKDCRNRSVDGGALWMFAVSGTHFVGLLVYLASRPQGSLMACEHCGFSRLPYVALCPHCKRQVKPC